MTIPDPTPGNYTVTYTDGDGVTHCAGYDRRDPIHAPRARWKPLQMSSPAPMRRRHARITYRLIRLLIRIRIPRRLYYWALDRLTDNNGWRPLSLRHPELFK